MGVGFFKKSIMEEFKRNVNPKDSLSIGLSSEIIKICQGILQATPEHYNNQNGLDETTCPFCGKIEYGWEDLKDINHDPDCVYLLAQKILDRINK